MQARVVCDLPEMRAAIGLSAGTVVAAEVCRRDLEGIVAKLASAPYDPDAPSTWVKIRNPGYTQAEGRWELFAARRGEPQRRAGA